jgi:HTH-type transcriptional regulator/antitoxin HigA
VCKLLGISSINEESQPAVAARRSNAETEFTPEQIAWVARVERLGSKPAQPYDGDGLVALAAGLVRRLERPQDVGHLRAWLAECGVALVIELPLRNSKIDGVVSLSTGFPIVGLSTRGDRMDSFVFTLLHEIAHLTLGHVGKGGLRIDEDIETDVGSEREHQANELAGNWIFNQAPQLPLGDLTPQMLVNEAKAHGVHVSFLIGRLQREGRLRWSEYRRTIPRVRPFVDIG